MDLSIQIKSIVLSFLFGMFFNFNFNFFYYILFTKYKLLNVITNFVFCISMFSVYFYLLYLVNNGIIHVYFFIAMLLGFLVYNKKSVKLRVKWKKINFK